MGWITASDHMLFQELPGGLGMVGNNRNSEFRSFSQRPFEGEEHDMESGISRLKQRLVGAAHNHFAFRAFPVWVFNVAGNTQFGQQFIPPGNIEWDAWCGCSEHRGATDRAVH